MIDDPPNKFVVAFVKFMFWLILIIGSVTALLAIGAIYHYSGKFYSYANERYFRNYSAKNISELDGDWEYTPSLYAMAPLYAFHVLTYTFSNDGAWDFANSLPYRARVKNGIIQTYAFCKGGMLAPLSYMKSEENGLYNISEKTYNRLSRIANYDSKDNNFHEARTDENIECDVSEMFTCIPLKFFGLSEIIDPFFNLLDFYIKEEYNKNFEIFSGIKYLTSLVKLSGTSIMPDENAIEKHFVHSQEIYLDFDQTPFYSEMNLIKSEKNPKELFSITEIGMGASAWFMSLKNIGARTPSADLPIVFFDELNVLDAEEVAKIEVLSIAWENLSELPEKLRECKNLKKLFIPYNKLRFTSRDMKILTSLKNLEILDIRYNDIANSPDPNLTELKKLTKLRRAYIAGKNFGKDNYVPTVFAEIPSLELLSISYAVDVKFSKKFRTSKTPKYINITKVTLSKTEGKNLLIEPAILRANRVPLNCIYHE